MTGRLPFLQPASDDSVWNRPIGINAQWQADATAPEIIDLRHAGTINANNVIIVGQASDPVVTITSNSQAQDIPLLSASVHMPVTATTTPNTGTIDVFDVTQPTKLYTFFPASFTNGKDATGGFSATYGEVNDPTGVLEDQVTGKFGYCRAIGMMRAWELKNAVITHALSFYTDQQFLTTNTVVHSAIQPLPWPAYRIDSTALTPGSTFYSGHLQAGVTIGIPHFFPLPTSLTAGGRILFTALQNYGAIWRGTAPGGVTFEAEAGLDGDPLIQGMRADLPQIVNYLCIMTNQSLLSKNGGGRHLAAPPTPLDPSYGGTVATIENPSLPRYDAPLPTLTASTWSPTDLSASISLSIDNLTATSSTGVAQSIRSSTQRASGKVYFEVTAVSMGTDFAIGLCNVDFNLASVLGADQRGLGFYPVDNPQSVWFQNALQCVGTSSSLSGDTISVAVDFDRQLIWFSTVAMRAQNANLWNNDNFANPVSGIGGISFAAMTAPYYIVFNDDLGNCQATINFGMTSFQLPTPNGFLGWDVPLEPQPPLLLTATTAAVTGQSADGSVVTTVGPVLVGSDGTTWGLASDGLVVVNGVEDTTTSRVVELYFKGGVVYQQNADLNWWYKRVPSDLWTSTGNPVTTGPIAPTVGSPPTSGLRNWYESPGMDGSFWVSPFYNTAQWTTSGNLITVLRNGTFSSPHGFINMAGNYSAPWYIGRATDPIVSVTNGSKSINVHVPLGAVAEGPSSSVDQSIGGADVTQPYLVWSISGASINTGSVQASGTVISGTYGFQIDDGAGAMMTDRVTGQLGTNNSFGNLLDYDLTKARLDPNWVMQHMLAFQMDPTQAAPGNPGTLAWPLNAGDGGANYTGVIPQGVTIGIPATTPRPSGKSRGFYLLFDNLQQYGWFNYNFGSAGCTFITCYSTDSANTSLANDCLSSISDVMNYVCILANQTGAASMKGFAPGGVPAFAPPPPLDLSPTGNKNILPSTFGAWYPSGYNALPTNTVNTPAAPTPVSPPVTVARLQPNVVYWGVNGHFDQGGPYATFSAAQQFADIKAIFGSASNTVLFRAGYNADSQITATLAAGIIPVTMTAAFPNWSSFANEAAAYNGVYTTVSNDITNMPHSVVWEVGNEWDLQNGYANSATGSTTPAYARSQSQYALMRGAMAGGIAAIRDHAPTAQIFGGANSGFTHYGNTIAMGQDLVNYQPPTGSTRNLLWDFTVVHWYRDYTGGSGDMGDPTSFYFNQFNMLNDVKVIGKPLICSEFGASMASSADGAGAAANITALMNEFYADKVSTINPLGFAGGTYYQLYQTTGQPNYLAYYVTGSTSSIAPNGTAIKNWLASNPTVLGAPSPTPTVPTPPASTFLTPTSGGSVTDAAGNKWSLDSGGNLIENGAAIVGGAGTSALTVVSGVIWAQDAGSLIWYTYVDGLFVQQSGSPPVPVPVTPPPTPAPPPTPPAAPSPTIPTPTVPTAPIFTEWYNAMAASLIANKDLIIGVNVYSGDPQAASGQADQGVVSTAAAPIIKSLFTSLGS